MTAHTRITAFCRLLEGERVGIVSVGMGMATVKIPVELSASTLEKILHGHGFELVKDKRKKMVIRVKGIVAAMIRAKADSHPRLKNSHHIAQCIGRSYSYISRCFSAIEGVTLEKYIISQRIDYAKELILYSDHSLSEISKRLNYSSVQHLSMQFKKITGKSVSQFRNEIPGSGDSY